MAKLDDETLDHIGRLADKADNFAHAAQLPLPPAMHVGALKSGMEDMRDELRQLFFDCGGDPETWADR